MIETDGASLEQDTKDDILMREVQELVLERDPEVILLAARVVSSLPRMTAEGGELRETQTLQQRIGEHVGRYSGRESRQ
jgi:hypothetical protein